MIRFSLLSGSYTLREGHVPDPRGESVVYHSVEMDDELIHRTGAQNAVPGAGLPAVHSRSISRIPNPSWINPDKNRGLIYVATEVSGSQSGLYVYSMESLNASREQEPLGAVQLSDGLCHLSLIDPATGQHDPSQAYSAVGESGGSYGGSYGGPLILASSYGSGILHVVDVGNPAHPKEIHRVQMHLPSAQTPPDGRNHERQESPHIHFAAVHPQDGKIYCADLGSDRIWIIRNYGAGETPNLGYTQLPWGYGPRHLEFDSDGVHIYALCELKPRCLVFRREQGGLTLIHDIDISSSADLQAPSAIQLHPSGRTLALSNRFADEIIVLSLEREAGGDVLRPRIQRTFSCGGRTPRDMSFSPGGEFLAVGNQDSHEISIFPFDPAGGSAGIPGGNSEEDIRPILNIAAGSPARVVWMPKGR